MRRPSGALWLVAGLLASCKPAADDRLPAAHEPDPTHLAAARPAAPDGSRVLSAARFPDRRTRDAYDAARRNAAVLEHIYCHCRCRENIGHRALIECFETDHAASCDICQTEAVMAARLTAAGRSPGEIQSAIDAVYRS